MTQIIGLVLVLLGFTMISFVGYVLDFSESITSAIMYCLITTLSIVLVAVGYYLITGGE